MRRLLLTAAAILLLPAAAAGQKPLAMQPGTWTGSVTPPNAGQAYALQVEVTAAGDSVTAMMSIQDAPLPPFPLQEIKVTEEGKLVFGFDIEVHVLCTLAKAAEGPNWEGGCAAADGSSAPMVLTPPKPKE